MIARSFITLAHRTSSIPRLPPKPVTPLRLFPLASLFATTSSGPTLQQKLDMAVEDIVNKALKAEGKKKIAIFSKSYCPYCKNAKSQINTFIENLAADQKDQVEVDILELDERDDGTAIQNYLAEKTKQRTVPNIFIGEIYWSRQESVGTDNPTAENHVGGSSDLARLKDADIKKLLFASAAA
ncbi:Glutaredoxin-1 OS=Glomus intraradices GN=GRX1 PE=2 SV=2 [Rhizoctonia solani AG-1 IB]|uniref:Glutaredoxin-1 n=1 Tax=Thanatephorus cucumeris (strain AG1-IB / isolate 7/3/14) TaxID=1108050 RepID=A0A0B7G573_THACB|nr:Glutaredoxin-1 OS=Glomus intraradices GN=GRX1 PE=2 SV=2 [Rhizoctonia solani AG-1 IB]